MWYPPVVPQCVHTYPESRNFRQFWQFRQCFDNSGRMCICRKCRNSRLSTILNLYSLISSTIPAKFSNCRNRRNFAGIAENFWILANTQWVSITTLPKSSVLYHFDMMLNLRPPRGVHEPHLHQADFQSAKIHLLTESW